MAEDADAALQGAVRALIDACELDANHKDLKGTPARVSALWQSSFLRGYSMEPAEILGDLVLGEAATELVVVRDIPFQGMCPHHLLPYLGTASVAYLPGDGLLGFGRLAELVRCFTARLTLQERACNDVADALMEHIGARGAGCVMKGEHMCLRIPEQRHSTSVVTSSFRGELQGRTTIQDGLFS
ncbi:MAG: GTP cyclohydrolase I [Nannocystales bacterium]